MTVYTNPDYLLVYCKLQLAYRFKFLHPNVLDRTPHPKSRISIFDRIVTHRVAFGFQIC